MPFRKELTDTSDTKQLQILQGQIDKYTEIHGIGRKVLYFFEHEGDKLDSMQIQEGFFNLIDGLQFGRILDGNQYQVGIFKNLKLHGQGKRVNPNQIVEEGYFAAGYLDEDAIQHVERYSIQVPKKVNWDDYFCNDHRSAALQEAIPKESQAKKRYKDLMKVNNMNEKARNELQELHDKQILLVYGQNGSGKSTLANAFLQGTKKIVDDDGRFETEDTILYKGRRMFHINDLASTETKNTEYHPINNAKDMFLVEYPNLSNEAFSQQLSNQCSMQHILNTCEDLRIVLMLNCTDFQLERGAPMIELITRFLRITS